MTEKIIAAGGIVSNEEGAILLMYRRGKWDLPKGKLEKGETLEECAVREIEEETGLKNISIGDLIGTTLHYYTENGKTIKKESYWYKMMISGSQNLTPQTEEGIIDLRWVSTDGLKTYLDNSYPNIIEIVNKFLVKQ